MSSTIKTVGLIGAGAVGAYVIWGFREAPGTDFYLIAEGDRAARLRSQGLTINGEKYTPQICSPEEVHSAAEASGAPSLLFITVKGTAFPDVLDPIRRSAAPETIIMSLMNGIDREEKIGTVTDPAQIVHALIRIASRRAGSSVDFDPVTTPGIFFGEPGHTEKSERILMIEELFSRTALQGHFMEDILTDMWVKYCSNVAVNLPQAALGVGNGAYVDSAHVNWMRTALETEVIRVAAAYGIRLQPQGPDNGYKKSARFSTLQDLDAGRRTETDRFLCTLREKAKAAGIEVPAAEYTWHLLKALEEKNEGLFDYKD